MSAEVQVFDQSRIQNNITWLAENPYPGRGIVLGNSADNSRAVQAYWVMGRSDNSRNRVLAPHLDVVRTEAFDESKMTDPSLVIYNAMVEDTIAPPTDNDPSTRLFIVSNGDQTDSVRTRISNSSYGDSGYDDSFRNALLGREFEPDAPNFTPRITGMLALRSEVALGRYYYSIIRRNPTTAQPEHAFGQGDLQDIPGGTGICFHTYDWDGDPVPEFDGSPYAIPLETTTDGIAGSLWDSLDSDNRVALAVKTIDKRTGEIDLKIVNQLAA